MNHKKEVFVLDEPKVFYVTYPLPIEAAAAFPFPKAERAKEIPLNDEKDFEPIWYGKSCFPEEEK